jgi:hypothetical protein
MAGRKQAWTSSVRGWSLARPPNLFGLTSVEVPWWSGGAEAGTARQVLRKSRDRAT